MSAEVRSKYGVLIGVTAYTTLGTLSCVKDDVRLIRDALTDSGFELGPHRILDCAVHFDHEVDRHITKALGTAEDDAVVIVYFSGHGHWSSYHKYIICLSDFSDEDTAGRFVTLRQIEDVLTRFASRLKVVFVVFDACNRVKIEEKKFRSRYESAYELDPPTKPLEIAFLYAADTNQPALASADGPSYYTASLARVIRRDHPAQTFVEAVAHARNEMEKTHGIPEDRQRSLYSAPLHGELGDLRVFRSDVEGSSVPPSPSQIEFEDQLLITLRGAISAHRFAEMTPPERMKLMEIVQADVVAALSRGNE